ncbi:efflux RND transporter periplasmic adaptor subunit [bacterium]|nr:efflux RND transporter periplasmic adaptor subunit [bacterium]
MKIDWKSKKTRTITVILAIIIVPILFNQIKTTAVSIISAIAMSQPQVVEVANPMEMDICPEHETTGRVEAALSVDIIARVSGWLQQKYFEEGDRVRKGQKLFQIEPTEYILAAKTARATVNENTAVYKNSQIDYRRAAALLKEDLVSREYYDNKLTDRNKSRAALDGSIAQLSKARLDLSYTNITSPMNGRIGKCIVSVGNYVTPNSGVIAQIYSTNPMRVVFPLKSSDFIELKRYYLENKDDGTTVSVLLKLADGSMYESEGKIEFVDNKIDEDTGTVTMRALFDNKNELLVPGDYVNIIIRVNKSMKVMLIPQSATKTDVGTGYYVWTVKNGKAVKKEVVVKESYNNCWIVESGLDYNDKVVMQGIQNVYKTGQKLKTKPFKFELEKKNGKKEVK